MTPRCPVCNRLVKSTCVHRLLQEGGALDGSRYSVHYTWDNKTEVVKRRLNIRNQWIDYPDETILELDGFHIMTVERVERLLLLK